VQRPAIVIVVLGLALLALSDSTAMADPFGLPSLNTTPLTASNWSGFYLGALGGVGVGRSDKTFSNGTSTGNFQTDGEIGGGTVGYNLEWGSVVAGLEGDLSATGISGTTSCPNQIYYCGTENSWLATVRPRLGYSTGDVFFYGTGGFAVGDVTVQSGLETSGAGGVDFTNVEAGWTAGAGAEMLIYSNWSLKAEFLYVHLPDSNGPSNRPPITTATRFDEDVFRLGLNYSLR
jgi:outer membrane immunogenic protein